jgi:hypothetical protein
MQLLFKRMTNPEVSLQPCCFEQLLFEMQLLFKRMTNPEVSLQPCCFEQLLFKRMTNPMVS